MYVTILGNSLV